MNTLTDTPETDAALSLVYDGIENRFLAHARKMERERDDARKQLRRLTQFLESETFCPCCDQTKECLPECTFKDDCPSAFSRVSELRRLYDLQKD